MNLPQDLLDRLAAAEIACHDIIGSDEGAIKESLDELYGLEFPRGEWSESTASIIRMTYELQYRSLDLGAKQYLDGCRRWERRYGTSSAVGMAQALIDVMHRRELLPDVAGVFVGAWLGCTGSTINTNAILPMVRVSGEPYLDAQRRLRTAVRSHRLQR